MKTKRDTLRIIVSMIFVVVGGALICAGTEVCILKDPVTSIVHTVDHLAGEDKVELGFLHRGEVVRCVAAPDEGSFDAWIENEAGEIVSDDLKRLRIMFEVPEDGMYFLVLSDKCASFTIEVTVFAAQ